MMKSSKRGDARFCVGLPSLALCLVFSPSAMAQTYACSFTHDCYQTNACTDTRERGELSRTDQGWQWTPAGRDPIPLNPIGSGSEPDPTLVLVMDKTADSVMLLTLYKTGVIHQTHHFWAYDEPRIITYQGNCSPS